MITILQRLREFEEKGYVIPKFHKYEKTVKGTHEMYVNEKFGKDVVAKVDMGDLGEFRMGCFDLSSTTLSTESICNLSFINYYYNNNNADVDKCSTLINFIAFIIIYAIYVVLCIVPLYILYLRFLLSF